MTTQTTRRWVLGLAAVASFIVALDTLVVSTALTTIRHDLHAGTAQLEWTVNAYNLSFAALLLPAAALGDRFGRRRLFAIGLVLFAAASAACALSGAAGPLIAARAIQGAGAALVAPLALALVSAAFPAERQGAALGVVQGLTGLAVASGPVVGGAVAGGLAWQWIFWINVPIALASVPFVLSKIPESRGGGERLDVPGVALVTAAAFAVVWALVRGNDAGWGSAEVVGTLLTGAVLVGGFAVQQRRAIAPMLPARLLRAPGFRAASAAMFLTFASLFSAVFFLAQFLQTAMGYSPLGAGLRLLTWTATLFFVAPVAGLAVDRFGPRPILGAGLVLQALGMGALALIVAPDVSYGALIAPLMVAGTGISMAIPAAQAAVVKPAGADTVGSASGVSGVTRELGGVFGIAIAVALFAAHGGYGGPVPFSDGVQAALLATAGFAAIGAVAAVRS